jgi:chlorite dismutase
VSSDSTSSGETAELGPDEADGPSEAQPVTLGHFATHRFTPRFWTLTGDARRARAEAWLSGLSKTAEALHLYQVGGLESGGDLLVWSSARLGEPGAAGSFFTARAAAENPHRDIVDPVHVLWGMTRPSEYSSRARSAQEIDPFDPQRAPYLVMYPFTKTADWYLLGRDIRQGMMNEHIRIGKQYREITQLLLYSFGLQDQEFVVVYETDDLPLFSRLVYELRDTEARRYTKADTPLHTGVLLEPGAWLETLA